MHAHPCPGRQLPIVQARAVRAAEVLDRDVVFVSLADVQPQVAPRRLGVVQLDVDAGGVAPTHDHLAARGQREGRELPGAHHQQVQARRAAGLAARQRRLVPQRARRGHRRYCS
jgi:hypothetical protein